MEGAVIGTPWCANQKKNRELNSGFSRQTWRQLAVWYLKSGCVESLGENMYQMQSDHSIVCTALAFVNDMWQGYF